MTKELFVSSTPHETKVGLVEDDQLAEIYLERENEYTLAGSIYKGRVTRVLPGMQSAFVDIGLERDAFLYVSDFMELEEHDEDVTDVVPVSRNVSEVAQSPVAEAFETSPREQPTNAAGPSFVIESEPFDEQEPGAEAPETLATMPDPGNATEAEAREPRGWRGRRRRRGRRGDRGHERGAPESRYTRSSEAPAPRSNERGDRSRSEYGPPPGYQPIILPGESISKYQRYQNQPAATAAEKATAAQPEIATPLVSEAFPGDEPLFAAPEEVAQQQPDADANAEQGEAPGAATGNADQDIEVRGSAGISHLGREHSEEDHGQMNLAASLENDASESELGPGAQEEDHIDADTSMNGSCTPTSAYGAASGTVEEEEIEEEEADLSSYVEELEEDAQFEEMEEETTEANGSQTHPAISSEAEVIADQAASESFEQPAPEANGVEEEEMEEAELEEAQEQAEALLDAEARGTGTLDARAEVRAPQATAGYQQRAQRPSYDRRRGGGGGRRPMGRRFRSRRDFQSRPTPLISDLLKEGQEILVQIAKEPIGKKGARITSHIALPGRFLVYMPTVNHTGVSRKIASEEERQRLKRIVLSERENGHGGFIVRTAAQGAAEEELRADIRFLKGLWNDIKTRTENSKAPALIYHDLNVVERVLRDQVTSDFSQIWVDTQQEYERILRFADRFQPALVKRVKLYTKETPLFEQFGLNEEINKGLKSKVWLKSGGYIVINQTEALVAIDVNTGKYVGKTSRLEDTIVKTNVDAIKEIVRQIRLRDLGGIIVIDFIDMDERRNRQKVMQALEEALRADRAPSKVLQFNDFGLVAITRKRVKQSLERTIGTPCPYCTATGYVKSVTTVCNEIYVEMRKMSKHIEHTDVMLRVHPEVGKALKANNGKWLTEMEELTGKTIIVKSDPALHQEHFDID
ncbi:MAG TPA: Rne/Rng family ribonuclease [Terriglobales bacterium]|nr:Rne/Rng family ribonuclease [Terriglobales bacterium]